MNLTARPIIQREPRWESRKLRQSAHMKPCTFRGPTCNGNPQTVVWCHSDHEEHGKGVGIKSHDIHGFFGCSACHEWYDTASRQQGVPNEERRRLYHLANGRSLLIIVQEGILK